MELSHIVFMQEIEDGDKPFLRPLRLQVGSWWPVSAEHQVLGYSMRRPLGARVRRVTDADQVLAQATVVPLPTLMAVVRRP